MNHAKRTDHNQAEIVAAARAHGLRVYSLHLVGEGFPDLVVGGAMPCPNCGYYFWQDKLVEIKMPGKDLEDNQVAWWEKWNGQANVAHHWEELAALTGRTGRRRVWIITEAGDPDQTAGTA